MIPPADRPRAIGWACQLEYPLRFGYRPGPRWRSNQACVRRIASSACARSTGTCPSPGYMTTSTSAPEAAIAWESSSACPGGVHRSSAPWMMSVGVVHRCANVTGERSRYWLVGSFHSAGRTRAGPAAHAKVLRFHD